jgi:beta-lactamase class A
MKYIFILLFAFLVSNACTAPHKSPPQKKVLTLREQLEKVVAPYRATVGISVRTLDGKHKDSLAIGNDHHYPTMSTYKFPLGLAVIDRVRKKELSLDRQIHVTKEQMHPGTYSPMRDKYPEGNVDLTVGDLLYYAVSQSDNNATDVLFELLGGTKRVEQYIHGLGFTDIAIRATEYQMGEEGQLYANWSSPSEMTRLLAYAFNEGPQDKSFNYLKKLMLESPTGMNRIRGLLPEGTRVADKTGTSGTDEQGITAAVNDVGILYLPDGRRLALAIFVSDSRESRETNEYIIAKIAQTVYAYYTGDRNPVSRGVELTDPSRHRKIPVRIYESAFSNGKVAIISGGYLSENTDYSFIANDLADKGYVVFSIQHDIAGDEPMAQSGDIYALRRPVWERGVASIDYVISVYKSMYPGRDFENLVLIGHSNGGDMSLLLASNEPERVEAAISLDHRRMPIPLTKDVRLLSIRSTDAEADPGVLPTAEEQKKYGIVVLEPAGARHGDLCDRANPALKKQILDAIHGLLSEED